MIQQLNSPEGDRHFWRVSLATGFASAALLFWSSVTAWADESATKDKDDALSSQRFELMQKRIADVTVRSTETAFPPKLNSKPIFRYSDPARGYVAAAVWKLGDEGRPRALITTELHRQLRGAPRIAYEYLSLTSTPFSAVSSDVRWSPESTNLEFRPIPSASAPDDTPQRRLLQMRAFAKRFAGSELIGQEKFELRLLPQPVDRYTPSSVERADGAIFLFAFGTNPEAALFIESDGKTWNFAAGRLTSASVVGLTFENQIIWDAGPLKHGPTQPYNASDSVADIPGIAPDGSEITK